MDINISSVRNIVRTMNKRNGIPSLPSGGAHHYKVDSEMKEELRAIISEYPCMSVKEINSTLSNCLYLQQQVTDDCISKNLDGMLFTLKKIYANSLERNSERVKLERLQYVYWYLTYAMGTELCVYIDEAGCNIWTQRTRGRSLRGQKAIRIVNGQRGRNMTLIMAIAPDTGIVHAETFFGGTSKVIYQTFINRLSILLNDYNNVYFIHDNCSCHRVVSPNVNHKLKNLPPYSQA